MLLRELTDGEETVKSTHTKITHVLVSTSELATHKSLTNSSHTEQTCGICCGHNESLSERTEASIGGPSHLDTIGSKRPQPTQHMNSPETNKHKMCSTLSHIYIHHS